MADGDTPPADRKTDPELGEPAKESVEPVEPVVEPDAAAAEAGESVEPSVEPSKASAETGEPVEPVMEARDPAVEAGEPGEPSEASAETGEPVKPAVEAREPVMEASAPVVEAGDPAPQSTHNIIAELHESMGVIARAGKPRSIRIRTHGRYGLTRFVIFLFVLFGYLIILAGLVALVFALGSLLTEKANQITIGSLTTMIRSLNDIIATRIFLSLATIWGGFLTIIVGRAAKAAIDRADYARQSLTLQKAIAEGATEIDARRRSDKPAPVTTPPV